MMNKSYVITNMILNFACRVISTISKRSEKKKPIVSTIQNKSYLMTTFEFETLKYYLTFIKPGATMIVITETALRERAYALQEDNAKFYYDFSKFPMALEKLKENYTYDLSINDTINNVLENYCRK